MAAYWSAAGSSPLTVPLPAGVAGVVIRLRSLQIQAANAALTIADSVSGNVLSMTPPSAGLVALSAVDIRTNGGNLVITNSGAAGINAQGDYVPTGYPYGAVYL